MSTVQKNAIKGGEFIIRKSLPEEIFTPEDFTEEQNMRYLVLFVLMMGHMAWAAPKPGTTAAARWAKS